MTPNLNIEPDIKLSLKQTFGIDSEMEVNAFSKKTEYVPEKDINLTEGKMTKKHANLAIKQLKPFKSVENVKPHGEFLLVAYTNYKDRAKIIKQLEKLFKYSSDGRMTNAPRVIGIAGYNWISFVSRGKNETFNAASVGKAPKGKWKDDQGLGDA